MHIVQVLSSMSLGGQERVALDLASGLCARGHRLSAIGFSDEGFLSDSFRAAGAQVFHLSKAAGLDGRLLRRLASLLAGLRPEVVHTHNPQPLLYAGLAARLTHVPVLVHTKHGANPDRYRRVLMRRAAAQLTHAYVAVSEETAAVALRDDQVRPPRLCTIKNGIQLGQFQPQPRLRAEARAELGVPEGALVVGTVGRLAPEKTQGLLIEAFARCAAAAPERTLRLLLVGDGPERASLAQAAAPLGDQVLFTGARRDVPRLLQAMDVFCLSSVTEGLPLVIPEAMASALPVLSTAVGGIPSVVLEGETGLLVPPRDADAYAQALRRLCGDAALRRSMGDAGRARALTTYSAERMVDDYEALYARLLGSERFLGCRLQ